MCRPCPWGVRGAAGRGTGGVARVREGLGLVTGDRLDGDATVTRAHARRCPRPCLLRMREKSERVEVSGKRAATFDPIPPDS